MVKLNLQYIGAPRIFAPKYPGDIFSEKQGHGAPWKRYPGYTGKIMGPVFPTAGTPSIFFEKCRVHVTDSLPGDYDEEVQNFIGVYPQRFLEHLAGVGVNSFFKPRTHD